MNRKRGLELSSDDEEREINRNAAKIKRKANKFDDSLSVLHMDESDDDLVCSNLY